jgi:hypothetical protein
MLAWNFLSKKAPDIFGLHPTLLDVACNSLGFAGECFGVKTGILSFLCQLTVYYVNSEDEDPDPILRIINNSGIISQMKSLLYETAGVPSAFFGTISQLLYNLVILDRKHVVPVCS